MNHNIIKLRVSPLLLPLVLVASLLAPALSSATTYVVNDMNDDHAADGSCDNGATPPNYDCTLRDALALVADGDTINFTIAGCNGVCTITLSATYGPLQWRKNVTLNGFSQTGAAEGTDASDSTFQVEINGSNLALPILYLSSTEDGGGTIKGLAFYGCGGASEEGGDECIQYVQQDEAAGGITITKNIIGMNIEGTQGSPKGSNGIVLGANSVIRGNIIGAMGYSIEEDGSFTKNTNRDVDGTGISVGESDSNGNTIQGNWIGVCPGTVNQCCGNKGRGVYISDGAGDNTVSDNTIGCNGKGIALESLGGNNRLTENLIGTDDSCSEDLGNLIGMFVVFGALGGVTIEDNVIGRNDSTGLLVFDTDNLVISGNTFCSNGTNPQDEVYTMTASPMTYGGDDYDWFPSENPFANLGAWYLGSLTSFIFLGDNETVIPAADGTNDFDMGLCVAADEVTRLTGFFPGGLSQSEAQAILSGMNPPCTLNLYCESVFRAQGAGADYLWDPSGCSGVEVAMNFQSPPEMIYHPRHYADGGGFSDFFNAEFLGISTVGTGAGITLLRSGEADIKGNTLTGNGVGLLMSFSTNNVIGREGNANTITNNLGAGIICDGTSSANNWVIPMTLADNCQDGLVENCQNLVIRRGCNNSTTYEAPAIKVATTTSIEGACCASADSPSEAASLCGNLSGTVTVMAADSGEMSTTVVCSDACAEGVFSCSGSYSGSGTLVAYLVDGSGNTTSLSTAVNFGTTAPEEWTAEVAGGDDGGDEGGDGDSGGGDFSQVTGGGGCSLVSVVSQE